MRLKWISFILAGVLAVPAFSAPQNPTQPGTINYIEGQAMIGTQPLNQNSVGTEIQAGQTLSTQNGKAEILLTPGVFLRMDGNSAVTMDLPNLELTHLTLQKGRAMVEVDQIFPQNNIVIAENGAETHLLKPGLYDFNAYTSDVRVFEGEAKVDVNGQSIAVKAGHDLAVNASGKLKTRGFDKKASEEDGFYRWASLRSSYLAEANVNTARMYVYGGTGWYGPGWYWSPWYSAYTWIPGDGIFWGPFGYGFFAPGFVGYAPFYGFGYAPFYHRFGPGYHPVAVAHSGAVGGFRGGPVGAARSGGFAGGGFAGGGFHGAGGGFHGGGGGGGRR